jgi:hypothetical protein
MSQFASAIDAAGLRSKFTRVNLFCGSDLTACRTPLYSATTAGGSPLGNATDTNINFVAGDYTETGDSGGLKGNGSDKRLETGLTNLVSFPLHMSVYVTAVDSAPNNFRFWMGADRSRLVARESSTNASWSQNGVVASSSINGGAFLGHAIGTNETVDFRAFYANGVQDGTSTTTQGTNNSGGTFIFTNRTSAGVYTDSRFAGYSIGTGLTSTEAAAFYTIMQAFQTALGRNK